MKIKSLKNLFIRLSILWINAQKSNNKLLLIFNIILFPLTLIYLFFYILNGLRQKIQTKKVNAFVICIGNVTLGGSGKTPTALALGKYAKEQKLSAAFISRGYNGTLSNSKQVTKVDCKKHTANEVGDEALLLAQELPTYISKNRYLSALTAANNGADIIIMDDGMQNFLLHKDITVCVFSTSIFLSNQTVLPCGFLREPLKWACKRSNKIMIIDDSNSSDKLEMLINNLNFRKKNSFIKNKDSNINKMIFASLVIKNNNLKGQEFVGMAGIAHVEKFITTTNLAKCSLKDFYQFPDHHNYSEIELKEVYQKANNLGCRVLTTSKDFVKIPKQYHEMTEVLSIELKIKNSDLNDIFAKK